MDAPPRRPTSRGCPAPGLPPIPILAFPPPGPERRPGRDPRHPSQGPIPSAGRTLLRYPLGSIFPSPSPLVSFLRSSRCHGPTTGGPGPPGPPSCTSWLPPSGWDLTIGSPADSRVQAFGPGPAQSAIPPGPGNRHPRLSHPLVRFLSCAFQGHGSLSRKAEGFT